MFAPFTVESSPLDFMEVKAKGVVSRLKKIDGSLIKSFQKMGIVPGVSISLEQRSPNLVIKVGEQLIEISPEIARLICVKLDRP